MISRLSTASFVLCAPALALAQLPATVVSIHEAVPEAGSDAGWSVAIGDINGDKYDDAIVGLPHGDAGLLVDAGRVLVKYGPAFANSATVGAPVVQTPANFGYAIAAGDVNGDGFDDLVVGAPDETVGLLTDVGRAYVIYGPALTTKVTLSMPVATTGADFGQAVAVGDVTGDGKADVIIGAPEAAVGATLLGRVYVFDGATLALVATLADPIPQAGGHFGWAVAAADATGDGIADIVVGAPDSIGAGVNNAGRALFFAAPTFAAPLVLTEPTPEAGANFGESLAMGDVNGDGKADVAAGIPDAKALGINDSGECAVLFAPTFASGVTLTEPVVELGADFGFAEAIGDLNDDGFGDVIVGAQDSTANGDADAGEAFVFYGPALTTHAALVPNPVHAGDDFGYSVASGDFNRDGIDDALIGAKQGEPGGVVNEGRAFAFVGAKDFQVVPLGLSAGTGGFVNFALAAGVAKAGRPFAVLGSALGPSPCIALGSICVPIALDPLFTPFFLNTGAILGGIGSFDGAGNATALTFAPAGVATPGVGLRFTFAWLTTDVFNTTSHPVVFEIVP